MHDDLWTGVDQRLRNARNHTRRDEKGASTPVRTNWSIIQESTGTREHALCRGPLLKLVCEAAHISGTSSLTHNLFGARPDPRLETWNRVF